MARLCVILVPFVPDLLSLRRRAPSSGARHLRREGGRGLSGAARGHFEPARTGVAEAAAGRRPDGLPALRREAARRPSVPTSSPAPITLVALRGGYLEAQAITLERGSLKTLRTHLDHLVRTLGEPFPIRQLTLADLQRHVDRRRSDKGRRGRPVTGYTIRKEITSLAAAWKWATLSGLVSGTFPNAGLRYPKSVEKPPNATPVANASTT